MIIHFFIYYIYLNTIFLTQNYSWNENLFANFVIFVDLFHLSCKTWTRAESVYHVEERNITRTFASNKRFIPPLVFPTRGIRDLFDVMGGHLCTLATRLYCHVKTRATAAALKPHVYLQLDAETTVLMTSEREIYLLFDIYSFTRFSN